MYRKKGFWIAVVLFVLNSFIVIAQPVGSTDHGARQALRILTLPGMSTLIFLFLLGILLFYFLQYLWQKTSGDAKGFKKLISVTGSILIIFSFFIIGGGNLIQRMQELAGVVRFLVALLLGVLTFFAVKGKSTEEGGTRNWLGIVLGFVVFGLFMAFSSLSGSSGGASFWDTTWGGILYYVIWGFGIWLVFGSLVLRGNWNPMQLTANVIRRFPSEEAQNLSDVLKRGGRAAEGQRNWEGFKRFIDEEYGEIDNFLKLERMAQQKRDQLAKTFEIWARARYDKHELRRALRFLGAKNIGGFNWFVQTLTELIQSEQKLISNILGALHLPQQLIDLNLQQNITETMIDGAITAALAPGQNNPPNDFVNRLNYLFQHLEGENFSGIDASGYRGQILANIYRQYLKNAFRLDFVLARKGGNNQANRPMNLFRNLSIQATIVEQGPMDLMDPKEPHNISELLHLINDENRFIDEARIIQQTMARELGLIRQVVENRRGGPGGEGEARMGGVAGEMRNAAGI